MKLTGVSRPLEVTTIGDVPAGAGWAPAASSRSACFMPCTPSRDVMSAGSGWQGKPARLKSRP